MLTESEFALWCDRVGLPSAAIETISQIRKSPPSRRVGGGPENVPVRYPSRKMQCTIQAESHTVEFPLVLQLEFDDDVLEYYCQPSRIRLEYIGPSGKRVVAYHTADFFVLRQDSAGWVEAKDADALPILAERSPNRYRQVGDHWECPPGKTFAEQLGLFYELHSSAYLDPVFTRNAQFLDDFLRLPDPVPEADFDKVRELLSRRPAITLEELLAETKEHVDPDRVYQMIASSMIHVSFTTAFVGQPDRVRVFADALTAAQFHAATCKDIPPTGIMKIGPGAQIMWDGKPWKVVNTGHHNISLLDSGGTLIELPETAFEVLLRDRKINGLKSDTASQEHPEVQRRLNEASPDDLAKADARMKQIQRFFERENPPRSSRMDRNLRRYISLYKRAEADFGNGYVGLIPRVHRQGNRESRLGDELRSAMMEFIKNDYETKQHTTKHASWCAFKTERQKQNLPYPTYQTYCTAANKRPRYEQTKKRKSKRAAYKFKEFVWQLDRKTPRHGDRPFEIGHIDHTEVDVELLSREFGINLGRAWLTVMMDAFSRKVLGHYLTFDPPSHRSNMMVIRDCIRRHNRLPQVIVVDGGKEFAGRYFEHTLARYEVTKKTRPPASPKFGSVLERLFGTTNTEFIHNLLGNTQIMTDVRQTTKSSNPKHLAVWDLQSLDERLEDFFYNTYETTNHPALGECPRDAFNAGMMSGPRRHHRHIEYNEDCLMTTSPSTPKGTAQVDTGRGVVINYFRYWSEEFRDPLLEGKQVPVRYDPWHMGVAWAYVHGHWVTCHSEKYAVLIERTQKEVQIASSLLRDQMRRYSRGRTTITATVLAEFLSSVKQDERIMMQRHKDREGQGIRDKILNRLQTTAQPAPQAPPPIPEKPEKDIRRFDDMELCDDL